MARGLTLDEFTALNDELSALTRLGVPLHLGLAGLSRDLPGKLGSAAGEIAERLGKGESLERILESPDLGLPKAYRAVIAAGSRCGQLTRALEETAATARRSVNARRSVVLLLTYPLLVMAVAYGGLILSLSWTTPRILDALAGPLGETPPGWFWLRAVSDSVLWWAPWPPVLVAAALIAAWRNWTWRGRVSLGRVSPGRLSLGRWTLTGLQPIGLRLGVEQARMATLLDLLGLMISHRVPLPEALVLAADATGVGPWQAGARAAAERLAAGERLSRGLLVASGLPSGLGWLVAGSSSPERWAEWLRQAADGYRRRADRRQAQFEQRWPVIMAFGLGGGLVLPCFVILVLPWLEFIRSLLR
jgi:type II secretory pathway component PulF